MILPTMRLWRRLLRRWDVNERLAKVQRTTTETTVSVALELGGGAASVATGVGFLDHMLAQLARHGGLGLAVSAQGDLHVDAHHTVEDVGLAIGEALDQALGDRAGVTRFGFAFAPMDEALARAVVDLSGRPYARIEIPQDLRGTWVNRDFPLTLVGEFWRALASRARITLHVDLERATDPHHAAESMFKAVAVALGQAVALRGGGVPSTKGTLCP